MKKIFDIAIDKNVKVKLIYLKDAQVIERIIKPYKVTDEHVLCYDYFRKQKRTYKLDNVLGAELITNKEL
jgi:predicted DNA-binding transcriptional regulator YafY